MAKKQFNEFNGGVTFGGVSIGDNTARLGIAIDRGVINLNRADDLFCNRRLTGKVVLGMFDEGDGQGKLIDDVDHEVAGAFDVKGFRCSADVITIGATFSLKDIDIAELAKFSKGQGRLIVQDANDIPEVPKEPPVKPGVPGTLRADGPWANHSLDELFDPEKTIRKALANADIDTVGQLADYSATGKRLTDIAGIGPGKAQEIEDVMLEFWKKNPEPAKA